MVTICHYQEKIATEGEANWVRLSKNRRFCAPHLFALSNSDDLKEVLFFESEEGDILSPLKKS